MYLRKVNDVDNPLTYVTMTKTNTNTKTETERNFQEESAHVF